jgi:hypothetical protein
MLYVKDFPIRYCITITYELIHIHLFSIQIVSRTLHAVKRFTTAQGLKACINRDTNACVNMRFLVRYWLDHGIRHPAFCRSTTAFGGP